jgi:predicted Zn-dependent peptidase
LLFMDTASYPEFDKLLHNAGIQTNANTDWDETNYYEIGNPKNLELMIKTQASMLREPLLRDEDIKNETRPVTEELQMRSQSPIVELLWYSLAAHAKKRGEHLMPGAVDEVRGVAPQTIRDLYKRLYSASNMTTVIIGGMTDIEAVQKLVAEEYGKIPNSPTPAAVPMTSEFMPVAGEAQKFVKIKTDIPGRRMLNLQFPLSNVDASSPKPSTPRFCSSGF